MPRDEPESGLPRGTLELLLLRALAREPMHGYGVVMHLHRASSAELSLQSGLSALHSRHERRRTNLFAAIGASYLAQSQPELAADYASSAVLAAKAAHYPLGVHRVRVLRGRLTPYGGLDAVRNLDEHLAA